MVQIPEELLKLKLRKMQMDVAEESRSSFLTFVKKVWPDFIAGTHHKIFAKKLYKQLTRQNYQMVLVERLKTL